MSSGDAQKSEVHTTTDDSASSPASNARAPRRKAGPAASPNPPQTSPPLEGGVGASDANSGGGAGAGIPGGGTDIRTAGAIKPGDPNQDRGKLFPNAKKPDDESDFGGPVKIVDPSI